MVKRIKKTKSISSLVPLILKPLKKKKSNELFQIQLYWPKIFNDEIFNFSFPNRIFFHRNLRTLEIKVKEKKIIEVSYNSEFILSEINRFFGDKYIQSIKFLKE